MKTVVTFGEIMLRLNTPGYRRLTQAMPGSLEATFAGAEANVAAIIRMLGTPSRFVTAVPDNAIGRACIDSLRSLGIDVSAIVCSERGRMGTFYVETGAAQRPSTVLYDREYSSFVQLRSGEIDWDDAFSNAGWFHVTGVTPSLSADAADLAIEAAQAARRAGLTVSCDLNFRSKLWQWRSGTLARTLASEVMSKIVREADVLVGNEEDAEDVFDIHVGTSDVRSGVLDYPGYTDSARELVKRFPNLRYVAYTLRESISATANRWGAMLYDASTDRGHFAPNDGESYTPYEIGYIVDRVGAGDAFAGSLIYALQSERGDVPPAAVSFAAAASCLAHSIPGDFCYVSHREIEQLAGGFASGRVQR